MSTPRTRTAVPALGADLAYDPLADCLDALRVIRDQANLAIQGDKRLPYLTHIAVLAATALARAEADRA